jgi:hypothetical protein
MPNWSRAKAGNVAQAYTMELLATEVDWSHIMIKANDTKIWFINGGDPSVDQATIAEYRGSILDRH